MTWQDDVVTKLAARMNTLAVASTTWTAGTNVFTGRPRPVDDSGSNAVPAEAVFCMLRDGRRGTEYRGGTNADYSVPEGERFPVLTVYVRGNPRDADRPQAIAEGVYNALHCNAPAGFYECIALGSYPAFVEEDDSRREIWIVRFELKREF